MPVTSGGRPEARAAFLHTLAFVLAAGSIAACGLGLYDDDGSAAPGTWWPFVCPDGGPVELDGSCLPPCPDGGADGAPDGSCS